MYKSIFLLFFCHMGMRIAAQCPADTTMWGKILHIETDNTTPLVQKLQQLYTLQKEYADCPRGRDSVYARLLHRIGTYEFTVNNNIATPTGILNTLEAIRINTSGDKGSSAAFAAGSYLNLGYFYKSLMQYSKALAYFDTTIRYTREHGGRTDFILKARINKCLLFKESGDYQKSIEECTLGLAQAREEQAMPMIMGLLNQRALSFYYQGQLDPATADADSAMKYAISPGNGFELASTLKTKALIDGRLNRPDLADPLFKEAIRLRLATSDYSQIADDYTDWGNHYLYIRTDNKKAKDCYTKALEYANKANNNEKASKAYGNLGALSFYQGHYGEALQSYSRALEVLIHPSEVLIHPLNIPGGSIPDFAALQPILDKDLVLGLLANQTDAWLQFFKQDGDRRWLDLSLHTALLADTLLTAIRHEQISEQSKLYWRDHTREIFTHALEACYLSHDASLAFFFMEKSRAVLLNDKLNELGAQAHLPPEEALTEQRYLLNTISAQQQLATATPGSSTYPTLLLSFLRAKEDFERYIRSLENRFPAYYQYKYADEVPSLKTLQAFLSGHEASFIHYYMNDTLVYMLGISASETRMIRLSSKELDHGQISAFLQQCADKTIQNNRHDAFTSLSNRLYRTLFEPMQITTKRVIVCPDHFLLPFEALCTDSGGRHFLLEDHLFSYAYSARSLLKDPIANPARGNFIGFAPVSFQPYLELPDLKQSAIYLRTTAGHYTGTRIFTNASASKRNFLDRISGYSIVNVFSHASADTGDNEPLLFLQDSIIRLSELQLLPAPATRLMVLSACQTNVGKNANGEGIYSLARGFAAAGIPSVASTMWQADDLAIYVISEKFHQYLAAGDPKDLALQKAKMEFIHGGGIERSLPYFWANMILIGNPEPVRLLPLAYPWWMIGVVAALLLLCFFMIRRHRRRASFLTR